MARKKIGLEDLEDLNLREGGLPVIEDLSAEELEAQAEKIREEAQQTREWVLTALSQIQEHRGLTREAQELIQGNIDSLKQRLAEVLDHQTPAIRRAARMASLLWELSQPLARAQPLLKRLTEEGYLCQDQKGLISCLGKRYVFSPACCFGPEEEQEALRAFARFFKRAGSAAKKRQEEKAAQLRDQEASRNLKDLASGKPGTYLAKIPPEKIEDSDLWRGGGVLLIQSDGTNVRPLDAAGKIEAGIVEARELGIFLKVYALAWSRAPVIPGLSPEKGKKVQLLWHLLLRAMRAQERENERLALREKATVSMQNFFLSREEGICLAEFQGTWQMPDKSEGPSSIFFLAERTNGTLRIAGTPESLTDFFSGCQGEYEEGPKYKGCPQPLQAVMRAIHGQQEAVEKAGQTI